jgi:hypothetical protein
METKKNAAELLSDNSKYLKAIRQGIYVLVFFKLLEFVFQFAVGSGAIRLF